MSDSFAAAYWRHLERPLRNLITAEARCLAAGVETYSGAYHAVLHHAIRRGALHLGPEAFRAIEDWIATQLLEEIDRAEAEGWQHWQQTTLANALRRAPDHG